jgi:hypothetical protein
LKRACLRDVRADENRNLLHLCCTAGLFSGETAPRGPVATKPACAGFYGGRMSVVANDRERNDEERARCGGRGSRSSCI